MTHVADHAHCEMCGKVVATGTRFCSPECTERHAAAQREKKKWMWIWVIALAGLFLLSTIARSTG